MLGYAEYAYIFIYIYIYVFTGIIPFLSFPILYTRDPTQPCTSLSLALPVVPCRQLLRPIRQEPAKHRSVAPHRLALQLQRKPSQSLQTRPNHTKLKLVHPATRRRPPFSFSFPSQSSPPTSSNPRESAPSLPPSSSYPSFALI
jgi:hypothetical protein